MADLSFATGRSLRDELLPLPRCPRGEDMGHLPEPFQDVEQIEHAHRPVATRVAPSTTPLRRPSGRPASCVVRSRSCGGSPSRRTAAPCPRTVRLPASASSRPRLVYVAVAAGRPPARDGALRRAPRRPCGEGGDRIDRTHVGHLLLVGLFSLATPQPWRIRSSSGRRIGTPLPSAVATRTSASSCGRWHGLFPAELLDLLGHPLVHLLGRREHSTAAPASRPTTSPLRQRRRARTTAPTSPSAHRRTHPRAIPIASPKGHVPAASHARHTRAAKSPPPQRSTHNDANATPRSGAAFGRRVRSFLPCRHLRPEPQTPPASPSHRQQPLPQASFKLVQSQGVVARLSKELDHLLKLNLRLSNSVSFAIIMVGLLRRWKHVPITTMFYRGRPNLSLLR